MWTARLRLSNKKTEGDLPTRNGEFCRSGMPLRARGGEGRVVIRLDQFTMLEVVPNTAVMAIVAQSHTSIVFRRSDGTKLLCQPGYLKVLKQFALSGEMFKFGIRSVCWKVKRYMLSCDVMSVCVRVYMCVCIDMCVCLLF